MIGKVTAVASFSVLGRSHPQTSDAVKFSYIFLQWNGAVLEACAGIIKGLAYSYCLYYVFRLNEYLQKLCAHENNS